jgi:hypothetical protein
MFTPARPITGVAVYRQAEKRTAKPKKRTAKPKKRTAMPKRIFFFFFNRFIDL